MPTNSVPATPENIQRLSKQLLHLRRQEPFQPFRIHLHDGRVFDIRYPELNIVLKTWMSIGIPEPNEPDPFADHFVDIDLASVREVELIEAMTQPPSELPS